VACGGEVFQRRDGEAGSAAEDEIEGLGHWVIGTLGDWVIE
jgi:hypothetical protein